MSTLVFQLVIKQWDKSQRSPDQQAVIANSPDTYPIISQPEFMLFDTPCVLDQHALDFTIEPLEPTTAELLSEKNAGRTIKKTLLADGRAQLDRFIIANTDKAFHLAYEDEEGMITKIGNLDDGWIKTKYEWRYRVEKNNEIYWQYEEVTLNAAWVEKIKNDIFSTEPPALIFNGV